MPDKLEAQYTGEELVLREAILAARHIQDFLWGKPDGSFGWEEWLRMFRKRVVKLEQVDVVKPYAIIEIRKRLLQQAGLSIAMLSILQKTDRIPEHCGQPSALPEFDAPIGKEQE